jgi:glycosyltransferase involved in cell wall biosynthesis
MKVRVAPAQPHCFAFGGFELQMCAALRAARGAGVDVDPLDPWSTDPGFDVLHLWGLEASHGLSAYWAKRSGKRVVLTALLPYLGFRERLRRALWSLNGRWRAIRALLGSVDRVVVVSERQAHAAFALWGFPMDRIAVIPNIVADEFYSARTGSRHNGASGYVLCVGSLCRRKNQLTLVKACRLARVSLLLVGEVLAGEEQYAEAVQRELVLDGNARWIGGLPAQSAQLVDAYLGASAFALVSERETQPIALLEAGTLRKPLLIADQPYARQKFYENARLVDPRSPRAIARGLTDVFSNPSRYVPNEAALADCNSRKVGSQYADVYTAALVS